MTALFRLARRKLINGLAFKSMFMAALHNCRFCKRKLSESCLYCKSCHIKCLHVS